MRELPEFRVRLVLIGQAHSNPELAILLSATLVMTYRPNSFQQTPKL
jgi:hypothetical protein